MDSGLYAAYTGLLSRMQSLDTAANNLANANTAGFRAQRDYFRGVLAGVQNAADSESQVGSAVNAYGILGGSTLDLSQGLITATGNPLDLAIDGQGFLSVRTGNGIRYTRDGSLMRSNDGTLTTQSGQPILGKDGNPITLPTGEVHIAADGSISVTTPEGSAIAGTLALSNFQSKDLLAAGTNLFQAAVGSLPTASTATLQQGSVEGANQGAAQGSMQLMLLQRQAEMMQKALDIFNNTMDKSAAEELGRV